MLIRKKLEGCVERINSINKVIHFHNSHFIKFVNDIIFFEKYELPPITGICNISCKYKHEYSIVSYNIFEILKIYINDYKEKN